MKNTDQRRPGKSKHTFQVVGRKELAVHLPLPLVEVSEEPQPQVERLAGLAGLRILRGVIEDEVTRRVGPRYQPDPASSCVRWGQQPRYVVFAWQKVAVECPRVCTGEGAEVQLDSYARLQPDGRRQRAVREGIVAGLTSWPLRLPDGSGVRTPRGPATQDKHHRRFRPHLVEGKTHSPRRPAQS